MLSLDRKPATPPHVLDTRAESLGYDDPLAAAVAIALGVSADVLEMALAVDVVARPTTPLGWTQRLLDYEARMQAREAA